MTTSFTDRILNDVSFKEFVKACSTITGIYANMKDNSIAKKMMKKEFYPENHFLEELAEAKEELKELENMTIEEAEKIATKEYEESINAYYNELEEARKNMEKYKNMLEKVHNWQPPTKDHVTLKNFMIDQIEDSIKYDCDEEWTLKRIDKLKKLSGKEYLDMMINMKKEDIKRYAKRYMDSIKNAEYKNRWITLLDLSLEE